MKLVKVVGILVLGIGAGVPVALQLMPERTNPPEILPSPLEQEPQTESVLHVLPTAPDPRHAPHLMRFKDQAQPQPLEHAGAARVKLDERIHAERVNPKWARAQEEVILTAMANGMGEGLSAPTPQSLNVQCRSSLCKVSMTFANDAEAADMHMQLTLGLRGAISTASSFFSPQPNGRTELVVYAGDVGGMPY